MKNIVSCLVVFATAIAFQARAQTDENIAVREVVERVFKAMEAGDSALLRTAFADRVSMATVYRDREGRPALRMENSLEGFLKAVGTPRAETWYEDIWDVDVKVDGNLAQLWCAYSFYTDKIFRHCGVDAFHLFKSPDGWKIYHLSDTRRVTDCNVPEDIRKKREQ